MKPFHYNQDPLYAAATSILTGQPLTEKRKLDWNTIKENNEEEKSDSDFKSLLGKKVHHGSPGYPTKEVISFVSPHKTKKGSFKIEFESGAFDVLSADELEELINGAEVHYKSPHGGLSVIELQEDEDFYSQKMIKNQLQTIVRNSNSCLQMIEDGREFPEWAQSEIAVAEDGIVSVAEFMQSHHDDSTISEEKWPTVKIVATDDHGLIRKGQTFVTTAETNSMGQTRLVIRDQDMPRMTMHPTLFLDKDGNPDGTGAWKRFAIVQQNDMTEASKFNMGTATITRAGHTLDGKKVQIFHKFDDGRINAQYVKSDRKGDVLNLTLKQDEYKLDEASGDELSALSTVMRSMGASPGDINAVRDELDGQAGIFLLKIVNTIASDTSLFNSFVTNYKK